MKATMSGQKISLLHKILSLINIFKAHLSDTLENPEAAIEYHKVLREYLNKYLKVDVQEARILDVGCGQLATQTLLFKADGAVVTGIDVEIPTYKINFGILIDMIKTNGLERAFKSLTRHILFDKRFLKGLCEKYEGEISYDQLDIRVMDVTELEFDDNTFDFIYSNWVFEHIENIEAAVKEVNRVLKPLGIARIAIHLHPSLSGGHHLDWISPDKSPSSKIPPWDHLLENKYPVNTYLNKFRLKDYRKIFYDHFKIADEILAYEGKDILTPEIERQLIKKGYTKKDLLTRTVTFLCRKKD